MAMRSSSRVAQVCRSRSLSFRRLNERSKAALPPAVPTRPIDPTMECRASARMCFLPRNCDSLPV